MMDLKIGILLSYDYKYILNCLRPVYENAHSIVIAIDIDRKTWSGEDFVIPDRVFDDIASFDTSNKIQIYEDKFYLPDLSPMECETRERRLLAKRMGSGGWHIQIDTDEYFVDFLAFVSRLRKIERTAARRSVEVFAILATLFKQDEKGYYCVWPPRERFPVATNDPTYVKARKIDSKGLKKYYFTDLVIHQSWARPESEIEDKIGNWGHVNDFDVREYMEFWKSVCYANHRYIRDFHPIKGSNWERLIYIEGCVDDLIGTFVDLNVVSYSGVKYKILIKAVRMLSNYIERKYYKEF